MKLKKVQEYPAYLSMQQIELCTNCVLCRAVPKNTYRGLCHLLNSCVNYKKKNTKDDSVKVNSIKYHSYSIFGQMVEKPEWLKKNACLTLCTSNKTFFKLCRMVK